MEECLHGVCCSAQLCKVDRGGCFHVNVAEYDVVYGAGDPRCL